MAKETKIYSDLRAHLDELPVGFPSTKSGVEIRILKYLFTPEEAKLALQLSMIPEPLDQIYARFDESKISMDELEQALDRMAEKGAIGSLKIAERKHYCLIPFAVGMYELQVDRLTEDFARDAKLYLEGEFGDELWRSKTPQLRTVPVRKSIAVPEKFNVSTYDDVRNIIDNAGDRIAVVNCICRQTRRTVGENCTKTDLRETCMSFRGAADSAVKQGIGRYLTNDEALALLDRAQEAGLVIQPENTLHPSYICCCCGDCCGILTTVKRFPRPAELYASNYHAVVDPELCTGCGTCVSLCQLDAITIPDDVAVVNLDRCIGCGNCVARCEFDASHLQKKEAEMVPPENKAALYTKIMVEKASK